MKITPRVLDVDCMHHFSGPKGRKSPSSIQRLKNVSVSRDPEFYFLRHSHEKTTTQINNGIRTVQKPISRKVNSEMRLENERSLQDVYSIGHIDYWNSVQQDRYMNQHQES